MGIKLVCTHELHGVAKGQEITDPAQVEKFLASHPHHFVKVAAPDAPVSPSAAEPEAPADAPSSVN